MAASVTVQVCKGRHRLSKEIDKIETGLFHGRGVLQHYKFSGNSHFSDASDDIFAHGHNPKRRFAVHLKRMHVGAEHGLMLSISLYVLCGQEFSLVLGLVLFGGSVVIGEVLRV